MHKQFKEKKEALQKQQREELLQKYGGAEHLPAAPPTSTGEAVAEGGDDVTSAPADVAVHGSFPVDLLPSASETYVEFSANGKVLKGPGANAKPALPKSKYEEDGMPI